MGKPVSQARAVCEDYLHAQIRYNRERQILPSECAVAERLLAHGEELAGFYEEIRPALDHDGIAWKHMIGCVLSAGTFWSPEKIAGQRAGRKELQEINARIAKQADALADLLDRRTALQETSGFDDGTLYSIHGAIEAASERSGHYQMFLKEKLDALSGQFDLKYWPSPAECIRAIAQDAAGARISADNSITDAATHSTRPSKADVLRALLALIEENTGAWQGAFPRRFELSNAALADVINVLLELPADEIVTDEYVKILRHRHRASGAEALRA